MRRFKILSIIKTINNTRHRYDLNHISGYYICPTINHGDKKTEKDFICEPDCYINSVEILETIRTVLQRGGPILNQRIDEFKIRNSRLVIVADGIERPLEEFNLQQLRQNTTNNNIQENMAKASSTAPSRSTANKIKPTAVKVAPTAPKATAAAAPKITNTGFEEIEAKILKLTPIRLAKFFKKNLPDTLEEFLQVFFTKYNNEHPTIYVDSKREQTSIGRRRSLGDIFLICKYYYPSCSLYDVVKILFKNFPAKLKGFRSSYCNTINKRVFYYSEGAGLLFQENTDEYGKENSFYTSKLK